MGKARGLKMGDNSPKRLGMPNEWTIRPNIRAHDPQGRDNITLRHISLREGMVRPEIILNTRMTWPTYRHAVLHYSNA